MLNKKFQLVRFWQNCSFKDLELMTVSDTCDSTLLNEVKVVKLTSIITVKDLFNTLLVGFFQTC